MEYKQFVGKMSSKDYLKYALLALLEEKNIYKITVKELCDRAMINRSTFYANYDSLDDFYQQIMEEAARGLVDAVESEGKPLAMLQDKELAVRRYTLWYIHVHNHADEFRLLLGPNGTSLFHELLLTQGLDWYTQLLKPIRSRYENADSVDILIHYIISAHLGLLEYYLESGMKYSAEYMAEQMVNITMAGPYSILRLYEK